MKAFTIPNNVAAVADLCENTQRYAMAAVAIDAFDDGTYRVEATNGKCLGRVSGKIGDVDKLPESVRKALAEAPNGACKALVPGKELKKLLPKVTRGFATEKLTAIQASDNVTTFVGYSVENGTRVTSQRNVEGKFPPTDEVMPKGSPKLKVKFGAKVMLQLLKVAAQFTTDEQQAITFEFFQDGTGPTKLTCTNGEQVFTGLLMPMGDNEPPAKRKGRRR